MHDVYGGEGSEKRYTRPPFLPPFSRYAYLFLDFSLRFELFLLLL